MSSLISVQQLLDLSKNPKTIILDATIDKVNIKVDTTNIKLIPNSLFLAIENSFSDPATGLPHTIVNAETFTKEIQKLGVNTDSIVVLYDRWGVYSSPRAWWMFKYMGFEQVFVLNGGVPAWEANQLSTTDAHTVSHIKGNFVAKTREKWFADKGFVLSQLNNDETKIIDARGKGRFLGTCPEPREGIRSGHIPHSSNIPFETVLDNIYLKSSNELKEIFDTHLTKEGLNIFTCGSGITASVLALAAQEAGYDNIAVYDGSWTEWGSDLSLPIEVVE